MKREKFIKTIVTGAIGMTTLSAFKSFTSGLAEQEQVQIEAVLLGTIA